MFTPRTQGLFLAGLLGLASIGAGRTALASPDLSLDDPIYVALAALRASGALPLYTGGLRPISEARAHALLRAVGLSPPARLLSGDLRGPWLAPVHRLRLGAIWARDHLRPYSTEGHPRFLIGGVGVTCEHREGQPCGDGASLDWELDSAAGYGGWLSAATRLRADVGTGGRADDIALDRAYASADLGPLRLLAGREALVLGPSAHTQAMWGDHTPPLDHVRLSTTPISLIGPGGRVLRASGLFFLGRLADPQTFSRSLLDGMRIQLDLIETIELGFTHLIQLGGDGAPDFDFVDYVLEHTRHNVGGSTPAGFANHRLSGDLALTWPDAAGLRVYYEIAAEDLRDQVWSMLRYDADHVLGLQIDRLGRRAGLLVELSLTGVRSHEHDLFATGFTSGGRIAGNPIGPSAAAAHIGLRVHPTDRSLVAPWFEVVRQSSDLYDFATGVIERSQDLPDELRLRTGARAEFLLDTDVRLEVRGVAERVTTADFIPGHTRWNASAEAAAVWTSDWRLGGGSL